MRALVLGFGLLFAQFSWALQGGEHGCFGRGPLEPFELMRADYYTYAQTCRIPTLVNDLIMKRHLSELRACWGSVLAQHPFENIQLPLAITVSEKGMDVLSPSENEVPISAAASDLRKCLVEMIKRIPIPAEQVRDIGGPMPWYLLGVIPFGIGK